MVILSPAFTLVDALAGLSLIKTLPASTNVKAGDKITIQFGNKEVKVEVLNVQETVRKEEAKELFRYLT